MTKGVSTIAIDGPAAAGKTVVGRELADQLEFSFLDFTYKITGTDNRLPFHT